MKSSINFKNNKNAVTSKLSFPSSLFSFHPIHKHKLPLINPTSSKSIPSSSCPIFSKRASIFKSPNPKPPSLPLSPASKPQPVVLASITLKVSLLHNRIEPLIRCFKICKSSLCSRDIVSGSDHAEDHGDAQADILLATSGPASRPDFAEVP